jgi:hypothetical protein
VTLGIFWLQHQERVNVLAAKLLGGRRIGIAEDPADEAAQTLRS